MSRTIERDMVVADDGFMNEKKNCPDHKYFFSRMVLILF